MIAPEYQAINAGEKILRVRADFTHRARLVRTGFGDRNAGTDELVEIGDRQRIGRQRIGVVQIEQRRCLAGDPKLTDWWND